MKKSLGFTLIELMIVLAIIAILSAFAMSSYAQYVARAERKEVQTEMLDWSARLEQNYALNNSFYKGLSGYPVGSGTCMPCDSQNGKYEISFYSTGAADDDSYAIVARAKVGSTAVRDNVAGVLCTPLTLNSATTKTPIECWD
jgi:type IV pilus assembly protein PilE